MKTVIVAGLKGGTGKSLMAAMLARYLSEKEQVILIDADIDSPNLPEILKVDQQLRITPNEVEVAHLDSMDFFSMGLVAKDKAISMSGESYVQILMDIVNHAKWRVDVKKAVTVIDAPAGASNIFRGCIRAFADSLVGVLIVIIPQAKQDLIRLIKILNHFDLPILGVIENMSYMKCECGKVYNFGDGGVEEICKELGVEYLGSVPLSYEIKELVDAGLPFVPDVMNPIFDRVHEKVRESKPQGDKILAKITKKVSDTLRKMMAKIVAKSVVKINKSVELKKLTTKGFGGKVVELVILDKGDVVTEVYMKLVGDKILVLREPSKVDLTITAELSALVDIAKGNMDVEDAYLYGEIEVFGAGGSVRALSFFNEIWSVMKQELVEAVGPEIEQYSR